MKSLGNSNNSNSANGFSPRNHAQEKEVVDPSHVLESTNTSRNFVITLIEEAYNCVNGILPSPGQNVLKPYLREAVFGEFIPNSTKSANGFLPRNHVREEEEVVDRSPCIEILPSEIHSIHSIASDPTLFSSHKIIFMSTTTNRKAGRPRKQDNPTPETAATRERWRKNNKTRYLKKKLATMESERKRAEAYKSPFVPRAATGGLDVPMEEYHTQLNQSRRAFEDTNLERLARLTENFSEQMQLASQRLEKHDNELTQVYTQMSARKLIGSQVSTTSDAMDHFHDTEGQTSPAKIPEKIPFSLDTASVESGMSTVRTGGPSGTTGRTGGRKGGFITPAPKFRPIVKDCTEEDLEEGVQYVESLTPTSPHSAALAKAEAEARAEVKARAKSPIAAWFGKCFGMDSMEEDAVVAAKTEAILSIPDEELFGYEPDMIKMFLADANELGLIHSGHARGAAELPAETVTLLARKVWFEANKINGKKKMAEFVVGKLLQEA